jgi:hypothetical protein
VDDGALSDGDGQAVAGAGGGDASDDEAELLHRVLVPPIGRAVSMSSAMLQCD